MQKRFQPALALFLKNGFKKLPVIITILSLVASGLVTVPVQATTDAPLPLGTLGLTGLTALDCPPGYDCTGIGVSCPGVTNTEKGFIAVAPGVGTPKGVIMLFTGGQGDRWWTAASAENAAFAEDLRAEGFTTVQVKWKNWLISSKGNDAGTAHLACRPATVINYVHTNYYLPLGVTPPATGVCGFCITGNSGGSSQVSYALSHYGLDTILDAVVPTEGPPHSVLEKACVRQAGSEEYFYPDGTRHFIDRGFGYFDKNGPCYRQDVSFAPRWQAESVSTGGNDYYHSETRVHLILSTDGMRPHANDYIGRLQAAATPMLDVTDLPNTPHDIMSTAEGRAALWAALTYSGGTSTSTETTAAATTEPIAEEPTPSSEPTASTDTVAVDTTAPTVALTSPQPATIVSGTVTVAADASDNVAVQRVEFLIDGRIVATTTDTHSFAWDTTTKRNKRYKLQAIAYDTAGNVGTSTEVVVRSSN